MSDVTYFTCDAIMLAVVISSRLLIIKKFIAHSNSLGHFVYTSSVIFIIVSFKSLMKLIKV
jgi:hypothetical protein